jgi:asparagine synthase (glutamine-hydrolysing)
LSILDLSPTGRQPMTSVSGRYVLAFNGEIYNHLELRGELEAGHTVVWRGHSDTETLVAGFDRWGIEATLKRTTGMFAIAVWDRADRKLILARDRLGEKPLYYGWQDDVFLFGSELKALRAHPAFAHEIDRDVVAMYLRCGYIAAPHSVYRGISKLAPGTFVQISATDAPGVCAQPQCYWSLREVAESGLAQPFQGGDADATTELEARLQRAVSLQSIADVPLGAFLSGGIDSSAIVALMQRQASRPVKTFTIGFHEAHYHEAGYARSVAQILGTDHSEFYVTPREAMQIIPNLPLLYDEPFGDSSAIPTFLVSQFARQHVTVCLSGDGGDELFGGYTRYRRTEDVWRVMAHIPYVLRKHLSGMCKAFSGLNRTSHIGWRARRLALYLSAKTPEECYEAAVLQRYDSREFVLGAGVTGAETCPSGVVGSRLPNVSLLSGMMYADGVSYLPDDILTKVDRASMGVSLETRVPMLDHNVVEFAWRLPLHMKVRGREAKWLLKQLLRKYIPATLIDRPKMGFGVPVNEWILGPLRDWAEDLVSEDRLRRDGLLNARLVRELWSRHVSHPAAEGDSMWQLLMLQSWLSTRGAP